MMSNNLKIKQKWLYKICLAYWGSEKQILKDKLSGVFILYTNVCRNNTRRNEKMIRKERGIYG